MVAMVKRYVKLRMSGGFYYDTPDTFYDIFQRGFFTVNIVGCISF